MQPAPGSNPGAQTAPLGMSGSCWTDQGNRARPPAQHFSSLRVRDSMSIPLGKPSHVVKPSWRPQGGCRPLTARTPQRCADMGVSPCLMIRTWVQTLPGLGLESTPSPNILFLCGFTVSIRTHRICLQRFFCLSSNTYIGQITYTGVSVSSFKNK